MKMAVWGRGLTGSALSILMIQSPDASAGSHVSCLTQGFVPIQEAHEIIDIGTVNTNPQAPVPTYKASGTNPVPDSVWANNYQPPPPYIRNTTRYLQFNESQFISSPGQTVCNTAYVTTSDGYTWGAMSSAINAMWPYNPNQYTGQSSINAYYAGNFTSQPPAGSVKVTANFKAQNMRFWANQNGVKTASAGAIPINRYFIRDQWGNEYIMHASGQSSDVATQQAFNDVALPAGWTKSIRQLKRDLTIYPAVGADGSFHYCVFRDNGDNSYHQISWSDKGNLEAQIAGMPIWGGQTSDFIAGDANGPTDDLIHGAGGNDRLQPGSGTDTVWGDAGVDTVILSGTLGDYALAALSSDYTVLELSSATYGNKTIRYCEYVRIGGRKIAIRNLPKLL